MAKKAIDKVRKVLKDNNLYYDCWEVTPDTIAVEIDEGDWKHEHLRLDHLIGKSSSVNIIHDDEDSDVYSAIHYYFF